MIMAGFLAVLIVATWMTCEHLLAHEKGKPGLFENHPGVAVALLAVAGVVACWIHGRIG